MKAGLTMTFNIHANCLHRLGTVRATMPGR